jgi:hypothetical protein
MAKATWIWIDFLDGHGSAYRIEDQDDVTMKHGGKIRRIYQGTYADIRVLITADRLMRKQKENLLKVYDADEMDFM